MVDGGIDAIHRDRSRDGAGARERRVIRQEHAARGGKAGHFERARIHRRRAGMRGDAARGQRAVARRYPRL